MLLSSVTAPLGSFAEKARFAGWAAHSLLPVDRRLHTPDRTRAQDLDAAGVTGRLRSGVVEPFLAGVLAERNGSSSAHLTALLVRSFVLGTPAVPSLGMSRLPELIAASLPAGVVRLRTPVRAVTGSSVRTDEGDIAARAVVVAKIHRPPAPLPASPWRR